MTSLIVNQLKTGAWKQVVPFGYLLPPAPYIVVKEEPTALGYTRWRIIGHIAPGNKAAGTQPDIIGLRKYMLDTIFDLLNDKILKDATRSVRLERVPGTKTGSLSASNNDGTLSLETIYMQVSCP